MLKLRFSKPSVKTYMDGRITVCRYECVLFNNNTKAIIMEYTSTGTAKCAEGDTLDTEYGRKLADSRAKLTAYKIAERFVDPECIKSMFNEIFHNLEVINFVEGMKYLRKKEQEHIEYLNSELSTE